MTEFMRLFPYFPVLRFGIEVAFRLPAREVATADFDESIEILQDAER